MMQGDQYLIPIEIMVSGKPADLSTFSDVEIICGTIRKTLRDKEITYDEEKGSFMFPVKQSETFNLAGIKQPIQVRCKFLSGDVIGTEIPELTVIHSLSKEVL